MFRRASFFLLVLGACGRPPSTAGDAETTAGTSTGTGSTSGTSTTTATDGSGSTDTEAGSDDTETTGDPADCWEQDPGCQFIPCPDVNVEPVACDPFVQDCPDGQRCTLVAEDDYDFTVACADLVPNAKQLGEPCTPADFVDQPVDDCGSGLVCRGNPWFSRDMDVPPVCRPICTGSEDAPECPDGMFCENESVPACYAPEDCNGT